MPAMSKGYIIEASSYHLVLRPFPILAPNVAKAESFKRPGIRVHIIIEMLDCCGANVSTLGDIRPIGKCEVLKGQAIHHHLTRVSVPKSSVQTPY